MPVVLFSSQQDMHQSVSLTKTPLHDGSYSEKARACLASAQPGDEEESPVVAADALGEVAKDALATREVAKDMLAEGEGDRDTLAVGEGAKGALAVGEGAKDAAVQVK